MRILAALVVVMLVMGCSDPYRPHSTRGQVFFRGEPAWGAIVTFFPQEDTKSPPATATVGKDGTYRLSTKTTFDGAAAGKYLITITYPSPEKKLDEINMGPDLLQGKYSDPKTTPLRAEVKAIPENEIEAFRF